MNKDIYKMKLHDTMHVKTEYITWMVIRVPGGWIYISDGALTKKSISQFVPYNNDMHEIINPVSE